MEAKRSSGRGGWIGIVLAASLLSSGCATAHPERVARGAVAGGLAGAALGAGLDHHDRGRGALVGGLGGLVIGAIFADELARHDWAHAYDDAEWCEEHHRWEPVEGQAEPAEAAYEEPADPEASAYDEPTPQGVVVAPQDVLFDPGSTAVSKGAQSRLQRLADSIRVRPDLELVLRGHADTSKRERDAFALSEQRAHEVRAFLADEGVPWRRMRIVGLGSARPVASNESASGRQRNRRVEIVLREVDRS